MIRSALPVILALCALPAPGWAQEQSGSLPDGGAASVDRPIAFVGVTVVPMDAERVLEGQTVLTRGDRIVALGPEKEVEIPRDAIRIEGSGRFLIPGMADLSVHLVDGNDLILYVANGVTAVRALGGTEAVLALRDEVAAGRRLGPMIVVGGATLDKDPPTRVGNRSLRTPEDARRAVAEQGRAGYDFVRVSAMLPPAVYAAVVEEARAEGIPVAGDAPADGGVEAALRAGQHAIDYVSQYVFFHFGQDLDSARIPAVAEATRQSGVTVATGLSAFEKAVSQMGNAAVVHELLMRPEVRFVSPIVREQWGPANPYMDRDPSVYLAAGSEFAKRIVRGLQDAGVRLVLGTDANEAGNVPGFAIHDELRSLVAAGLSPYEALRAATASAGEMLGQADFRGTVAVGKRADLVLLEADPLEDVANVARRTGVMVGGRWLPERALQHWLGEVASVYEGEAVAGVRSDSPYRVTASAE